MLSGIRIIAPLVAIALLGAALKRGGFLGEKDREWMTNLLYWVVLPCLLFRSMYLSGDYLPDDWNMLLATYAPFFLVPAIAIAAPWSRHPRDRKRIALRAMSAARANNVYLGLPAVLLAMGEAGQEAASAYIAIMLPGYNLLTVMWGEAILSGGLSPRAAAQTLRRLAKNPLVVSCLLGLAFSMLNIPVHEALLVSMKMVGNMATGLALFSLGLGMGLGNLLSALRRTWGDVLIKLFVHPAVSLLCFKIWPAPSTLVHAAVLLCAMPTAINTFILAKGMGLEGDYTSDVITVSTVGATISIPIWLALLGIG